MLAVLLIWQVGHLISQPDQQTSPQNLTSLSSLAKLENQLTICLVEFFVCLFFSRVAD